MLYLRPNSYLDRLLTLLTVTGEYPYRSLSLLGNRRVLTTLVRSLQQPQLVQIPNASPISGRILSVSGHGAYKTIRLHRSAFPLLQHLYPGALQTYLRVTRQHRFAGGTEHIGRNHRIAETAAMCMMAGIEIRPSFLAPLATGAQPYITAPSFYLARFLKQALTGLNKTIFTRITGMLLSPAQSYALYNARQSKMKWNGMGEFKALQLLRDVSYTATGRHPIPPFCSVHRQTTSLYPMNSVLTTSIQMYTLSLWIVTGLPCYACFAFPMQKRVCNLCFFHPRYVAPVCISNATPKQKIGASFLTWTATSPGCCVLRKRHFSMDPNMTMKCSAIPGNNRLCNRIWKPLLPYA